MADPRAPEVVGTAQCLVSARLRTARAARRTRSFSLWAVGALPHAEYGPGRDRARSE
ncbi:hypothetical protein SLNWT_6375 [Streptomyces albus]|uniref:Uncharacterized protein n=1 Tax=Streptomyces albus (strain ATCC 21838 / DSM 41398 / FERM P-419 / JCM 4703 / NBRC 107858) TaxID=1081613 RepID=A0A0B5F7A6_STRA4|nr:hypothetical protein SLNWT_6375 [Streptomyces albus]